MEKASFESGEGVFTVEIRAGASLARADIEKVVGAQAAEMELNYRVVWRTEGSPTKRLADVGHTFEADLLAGGRFDFANVLGSKVVVLTFWASWCKPCIVEAPHLASLHERYANKGASVVSVSVDELSGHAALRKVVDELRLPYPVVLDPGGEILRKYAKGASIPLTFVIDRSRAVVYKHLNFQPGDEHEIEAALKAALK